ncbi:unnamed protein product [Penicillium egyptiacum]|uniref:Beta-ketoacyl synthase-like N-terminal domain-containing protein n=1 Tax=Penicillium egyptiacum TaxID=1303716 RepID=A0A9W4PA74_9EURO|nr:unnamed protein product [Penicillium egyptiacum]
MSSLNHDLPTQDNGALNGLSQASLHSNGTSQTDEVSPTPESHSDLEGNESSSDSPIAICGMALRLPGGLASPQEFWDFLVAKGDARGRVPKSRYNISAYHSTSGRPGTIATEYGYFLDESVKLGSLDASRFSLIVPNLSLRTPSSV